MNVSLASDS